MICFPAIQCVIQSHTGFLHLDMTQRPSWSSQSALPHIVISLSALSVEVAPHPHLPQAVAVEEADEFPKVRANHIVLVDAATVVETLFPTGFCSGISEPVLGIRVSGILEAVITAIQPL